MTYEVYCLQEATPPKRRRGDHHFTSPSSTLHWLNSMHFDSIQSIVPFDKETVLLLRQSACHGQGSTRSSTVKRTFCLVRSLKGKDPICDKGGCPSNAHVHVRNGRGTEMRLSRAWNVRYEIFSWSN